MMMDRLKRHIIVLLILLSCIGLTGCWSNKDLAERALVAGIGLDLTEENKIELTLQIVKPSVVAAIEGGSPGEDPVWINSTTGDTVFEAVRKQLNTVNRKPYYSHVELIVIGEGLARQGIGDIVDFFERDHEPRLTSTFLIAKGTTAKRIMNAKSELEKMPAIHLKEITKNQDSAPTIQGVTLFDLLKQLSSPGENATIGVIEIIEETEDLKIENLKVQGSGVFHKGKLIGWLKPMETAGLLYVQDKVENVILTIPDPMNKELMLSIEQVKSSGKIDAKFIEDDLKLFIEVEGEGNIGSQRGSGDLTTQEMLEVLEKETAKRIEERVRNVVKTAQEEHQSDIFGFGDVIYQKYPEYWKQIQESWHQEFSKLPVEIKVSFTMRRTGLIGKTLKVY
jgi:spore germination protein KC